MNRNRRQLIMKGGLSILGGGFLARLDKVAAMQKANTSLTEFVRSQATRKSEKLLLGVVTGEEGPPEPSAADRLPVDWNKETVRRFKAKLAERGIESFLIRDPFNVIYLTGYWHQTTERPQATFMNSDDAAPWFFYPALDRDFVRNWWFGDGLMYFDFPHAEGGYPDEGRVVQGKTVDLFKLMLEGIKKHGVRGSKIGIDGELCPSENAKANEVLKDVQWINVADILQEMRMIKTAEELALWRRAYTYFDRAHAFARDYILTHGTDITDYEVRVATDLWINDQLYSDLDLADGAPNHGVRTEVALGVRVGPVTAYPNPNQPYYKRIARNMPLQIAGKAYVGGYGGENYRMFIIADEAGRFDAHMQKLWQVSQHCCDMQVESQVEGATCSSVAYSIHKYQVEQGVRKYVYHRPAHGVGVEGHQAPYLALGDYTVLRRNMCFSEEPGLFDPGSGCGFNWSDTVVTGLKAGYRMSRVPYSREWCWIRL